MGVGEASQIGPMKVAGMAGSHLGGGLIGKMYVSLGTCFALLHTLQHHLSKQFLGVMGGILHQALVKKRKRRMRVHQVGDWATRFVFGSGCKFFSASQHLNHPRRSRSRTRRKDKKHKRDKKRKSGASKKKGKREGEKVFLACLADLVCCKGNCN